MKTDDLKRLMTRANSAGRIVVSVQKYYKIAIKGRGVTLDKV
ncbi:MAG TPA: hypothetical protein ACFYEM_09670 [Candidatus Hypogeohydataceae bacterium YC40]